MGQSEPKTPGTTGSMIGSEDALRALRGILATAAVGSGAALFFGLVFDDRPAITVGGLALVALPAVWWMIRRGHVTAASVSILGLFNALTVYALCFGGGVQDPTALLFPVMIIASGILLDRRLAIGASVVLVASCIGVGIAELTGVVQTRLSPMLSVSDVVFLSVLLLACARLVYVMSRALRESIHRASLTHQSYEELFNATGEGIIVHDAETGEILDANESALAVFGYSREQRHEFNLDSFIAAGPPFDRATLLESIAGANEQPASFEWYAAFRSRPPVWLEVTLRPALIEGHRRIVAVFRDVSERRGLQEQVQQAEKMNAVGQLARGVAHDFNNQLTVILANASLIEAGVEGDAALSEYTRSIIESSRRSADLTQQLLAFARKGQRDPEPIDVDALVADVKGLLDRSIDKRIEVVHQRSETPAIIEGDATFLQNALLNLGLNARDAMPGGGTLRFVVDGGEHAGEADRAVTIRVEDTGCGMAEEVVGHIFEPFFTTKDQGNGMGLAAVYGTVTAHEGAIVVDSEPGRGTRFTITLPAAREVATTASRASDREATARHAGVRVLLAEDEPTVAKVAKEILARLGCEVVHVPDGARALEALSDADRHFDVALLDHSMPELTGFEVLQEIRAQGRDVPVIATSGYAEASGSTDAQRPDAFLPKPFNLATLSDALNEVLRHRRA